MCIGRIKPVSMFLALLTALGCTWWASATEYRTGQTWALLGGRLSIELPPDWGPAAPGEVRTPFDLDGSGGGALCRPDGAGFCVVYRFEGLASTDDPESMRYGLLRNCNEVGIRTEECVVYLVGGRRFAIAQGSWIDGERTVSLIVAASLLDEESVVLVFGAKGPESDSLLMAGQMALISVQLTEEGGLAGINYPVLKNDPADPAPFEPDVGISMTSRIVPGTGVTLRIPAHLGPALLSPGYIAPDLGVFVFVEPVGIPYRQALGFLGRDFLERSGMDLESSTHVKVDKRSARLVRASYKSDKGPMSSWILLMGEGERSIKIVARFPKSQEADFAELLREGLLQTVWVPGPAVFGVDDLDYTFVETKHLRTICRAHERVILAVKGSTVPVGRKGPMIVIDSSMGSGTFPDLPSLGRELAMTTQLISDVEIVWEGESHFAGFLVHEIQGTGTEKQSGKKLFFYQALLQQEGRCIVVHGIQDMYDHADLRKEFTQVAHSVRLRKMNN